MTINVDFHHERYLDKKKAYMLEKINLNDNGATSFCIGNNPMVTINDIFII
jgi:hypothetical protein